MLLFALTWPFQSKEVSKTLKPIAASVFVLLVSTTVSLDAATSYVLKGSIGALGFTNRSFSNPVKTLLLPW